MITFIRKALTSWFALGLLGLVVVAFAVTGIGDPFGSKGSGVGGTDIARVGKTSISDTRFLAEFDRVMRQARERNPKLTTAEAVREGAVGQVLDQMVGATALEDFGAQSGIAVSDRAVDGEIASVGAFQQGGKFDQATYRRLLSQQRLSERELRDGLHGDLIRRQLLAPLATGLQVPQRLAEPYAALLLETRSGAVATVATAAQPAPSAPTDAQLGAYYQANAARYTVPERRSFRYALLDRELIAASVAVADTDVQKYYDTNRDALGGTEQRQLLQVVVSDEAQARALVTAIRAGASFAAAAAKLGFAAADIDLGLQTQAKFAASTSAGVAKAAFAAGAGTVTEPVRSPFGWHVVQAARIVAARGRSLAEARPEILTTLRRTRAEQAVADTVARIEDALTAGTSFADVAKANGLTIGRVEKVLRDGRNPDVPGTALPATVLAVVGKAFDVDPADGATLQELGKEQFAMLEPGAITPPAVLPLARIRADVAAAWAGDQRLASAKQAADAIVAAVGKGSSFAAALAAHGAGPARPLAGRRIDVARQPQVPPPVALFLTLPAGGTRALQAPQGQGFWVIHVDTVAPGAATELPALTAGARAEFEKTAPDELAAAFARAVERQVGASRSPSAIAAVTKRILGTGAQ